MIFLLILALLSFSQAVSPRNRTHFQINTRIVGGETVKDRKDFAYQASVRLYNLHQCGGSIITSKHVLSAAHCFFDLYNRPISHLFFTVVVGDLNIHKPTDDTVYRSVRSVACHEDFWPTSGTNDIALIKLSEKYGTWTPHINKIELAMTHPNAGEMCVVSGWGALKEGGFGSVVLKKLLLPIMPVTLCRDLYRSRYREGMFCAGYSEGKKDSCQGDSGGPLVCHGVQYGLVSWGEGCARDGKPGVYTDVSLYRNWIRETSLRVDSAGSSHRNTCSCCSMLLLCVLLLYY